MKFCKGSNTCSTREEILACASSPGNEVAATLYRKKDPNHLLVILFIGHAHHLFPLVIPTFYGHWQYPLNRGMCSLVTPTHLATPTNNSHLLTIAVSRLSRLSIPANPSWKRSSAVREVKLFHCTWREDRLRSSSRVVGGKSDTSPTVCEMDFIFVM